MEMKGAYREVRSVAVDRMGKKGEVGAYRDIRSIDFDREPKPKPTKYREIQSVAVGEKAQLEHIHPFSGRRRRSLPPGGEKGRPSSRSRTMKSIKKSMQLEMSVKNEAGYEILKAPGHPGKDPPAEAKSTIVGKSEPTKMVLMPSFKSAPSTALVEPIDSRLVTLSDEERSHKFTKDVGDQAAAKTEGRGSRTSKRRRSNAALSSKIRRLYDHHPLAVIIFGVSIGLLILGVLIGVAVSLAPNTSKPIHKSFYEGVCLKEPVSKLASPECMIGSPPTTICKLDGFCWIFSYQIHRPQFDSWTVQDKTKRRSVWTEEPQLCRRQGNDELGVCSTDGNCNQQRELTSDPTWFMKAQWVDNCDQPNPCWVNSSDEFLSAPAKTTRERCLNDASSMCTHDTDAVVWMQHLRCKPGNNGTASDNCKGYPLSLWKCASCNRTTDVCASHSTCRKYEQGCQYDIHGDGRIRSMPDGTECGDGQQHCYRGICFRVRTLDNSTIETLLNSTEECSRKRRGRAIWSLEGVQSRRKSSFSVRFYTDGRKKDDLVGDVLKACPENEFMDLVDRTEAELWPEFNQVDKNLTECMTESGFKIYVDFCGNMRSVNYSHLMEKTVENARKEHNNNNKQEQGKPKEAKFNKEDGEKCWINALNTCVNQYPPPNEEINNALSTCEDDKKIAEDEERLGFEVGKRVMLKIVTKLKEAFDKEDLGEDDEDGNLMGKLNGTMANRTHKATPKPHV